MQFGQSSISCRTSGRWKEDQAPLKIGLLNSLGLIFYCYGHLLSFFTQAEWSNANWINCHIGSTKLAVTGIFCRTSHRSNAGVFTKRDAQAPLKNWINWLTHTVTGNYWLMFVYLPRCVHQLFCRFPLTHCIESNSWKRLVRWSVTEKYHLVWVPKGCKGRRQAWIWALEFCCWVLFFC